MIEVYNMFFFPDWLDLKVVWWKLFNEIRGLIYTDADDGMILKKFCLCTLHFFVLFAFFYFYALNIK